MNRPVSSNTNLPRAACWLSAVFCALIWPQALAMAQYQSLIPPSEATTDSEARLELARLLARSESGLSEAEKEYRRVLAASPGNAKVTLELAEVLARMRRYQEALALLTPLTDAPRPGAEVLSALGDILLYSGDVPGAAKAYSRAFSLKPVLPGLELKLAQALSWTGKKREALPLLKRLHEVKPNDTGVTVLLAQALAETGKHTQAAALFSRLLEDNPDDIELLLAAADIQVGMGRALAAKNLFERAEKIDATGKARMIYADRAVAWGDFYRAEDNVRSEIATRGKDADLLRKLASVLAGEQRYDEAAEVYEDVLAKNPQDLKALAGLARLRLLEKDPSGALTVARRMEGESPGSVEGLRLTAQAKLDSGDPQGALDSARQAAQRPEAAQEDLRRLGDMLYRAGNKEQAVEAYRQAAGMDPPDPWSLWRAGGERDAALPSDPVQLTAIATRLKADGRFEKAGRIYRLALERDPQNYDARMGRAELLAATGWHDEALRILDGLAADFPEVSKVMLARARILSWAKRYEESLAAYDELHRMRPEDPVPLREAARTAFWGKMPARGTVLYSELENGNYPEKIRYSAMLERIAKTEGFDRRFAKALAGNDKLLAVEPGNQEALFDRAQAACALGLCDEEETSYKRLLAIDSQHTLAGLALDRLRWRNATSLKASFMAWDEDGKSGRLAQITRYRWDMEVNVPVEGRYYLRATQHLWLEHPKTPQEAQQNQGSPASSIAAPRRFDGTYLAEGQTAAVGGRVNEWLSGEFAFTNKQYFDAGLRPLYSGLARIEVNLRDLAKLGVFYQRTDEITNDMSLAQGIQIDNWGGSVTVQPTRRVELSFQGKALNYSDGNQGVHLRADVGVTLTDHPRELKLSATGEYRDTRELNKFVYAEGTLMTIVHPYWTPQRYYSGALTLGWRHDLAKEYYCGARQHFYGVQFSGGTDTDRNPFWRLEAEYLRDISDRWSVSVKGLIHRSQQWDALGAWTGLTYRF